MDQRQAPEPPAGAISDRLKDIVYRAIALPTSERRSFIAAESAGDTRLALEALDLVVAHESAGSFLGAPTNEGSRPIDHSTADLPKPRGVEQPGTRVGPYKLLELIGEGGFGSVFMAEQSVPISRRVALKIIKPGMDSRMVAARFDAERQALALMEHPHIARMFDGGVTDASLGSRPYFVMEYVKGDPITNFADAHKLPLQVRLDLFTQVCQAVQHAHMKGVIHRDLKPSNVLVNMTDGRPFAKVIDFGIAKATGAKLTERTLFTEHRQLIGTPEYMSPEQADGSPDLDTRTDVYALGVLLYELLTGSTPFEAKRLRSAAFAEMQRIIKEEEPQVPSVRLSRDLKALAEAAATRRAEPASLGAAVKGELDWIVMKCLDKDRGRRYESPSQLADDVRRHINGDAVVAAPPSLGYRVRKFARRRRVGLVTASCALAGCTVAGSAVLWSLQRATAANAELRTANTRLEESIALGRSYLRRVMTELSDGAFAGEVVSTIDPQGRDVTHLQLIGEVGEVALSQIKEGREREAALLRAKAELLEQVRLTKVASARLRVQVAIPMVRGWPLDEVGQRRLAELHLSAAADDLRDLLGPNDRDSIIADLLTCDGSTSSLQALCDRFTRSEKGADRLELEVRSELATRLFQERDLEKCRDQLHLVGKLLKSCQPAFDDFDWLAHCDPHVGVSARARPAIKEIPEHALELGQVTIEDLVALGAITSTEAPEARDLAAQAARLLGGHSPVVLATQAIVASKFGDRAEAQTLIEALPSDESIGSLSKLHRSFVHAARSLMPSAELPTH